MTEYEIIYPKSKKVEKAVSDYFQGNGFRSNKIIESKYPGTKVPDLLLTTSKESIIYAEVKCPQYEPTESVGGYSHHAIHSKINDIVHNARKQFIAFNSNGIVPNIIIWVSFNFQLDWHTFIEVAQGNMNFPEAGLYRDFESTDSRQRSVADWGFIDGHCWFQASFMHGQVGLDNPSWLFKRPMHPILEGAFLRMPNTKIE